MFLRFFFLWIILFLQSVFSHDNDVTLDLLSRIHVNGQAYLTRVKQLQGTNPTTRIHLLPVDPGSPGDHIAKLYFTWHGIVGTSEAPRIQITPAILKKRISGERTRTFIDLPLLSLPLTMGSVDPNLALAATFRRDIPFSQVIQSIGRQGTTQQLTASHTYELEGGDSLTLDFIFARVKPLVFLNEPVITLDQGTHTTTIGLKCHFEGEGVEKAVSLKFSQGKPVFEHALELNRELVAQWSVDGIGRLFKRYEHTYKVDTPDLAQWRQTSIQSSLLISKIIQNLNSTGQAGIYKVVVDGELAGQILGNNHAFCNQLISRAQGAPEIPVSKNSFYIVGGAESSVFLAHLMKTSFVVAGCLYRDIRVLRPTNIQLSNYYPDGITKQGTFYQNAFYKLSDLRKVPGSISHTFIEAGNSAAEAVTLTQTVSADQNAGTPPLAKVDLTKFLEAPGVNGQPTLDELKMALSRLPVLFGIYSHTLTIGENAQKHVCHNFYRLLGEGEDIGAVHFSTDNNCRFGTLMSRSIDPELWAESGEKILKGLELWPQDKRSLEADEVHVDWNDTDFVDYFSGCSNTKVGQVHLYCGNDLPSGTAITELSKFFSMTTNKYNKIIVHAGDRSDLMTSPQMQNFLKFLLNLKDGIWNGHKKDQPRESGNERVPSWICDKFSWFAADKNAPATAVPPGVKNVDEYLSKLIDLLDPRECVEINYVRMRGPFPLSNAAFVAMLEKLGNHSAGQKPQSLRFRKLNMTDSKFFGANQFARILGVLPKLQSMESFSWYSPGAYQVDNHGWFTCNDSLFSSNSGVVTELLQLVRALKKVGSLRELNLNMCYLSSYFTGYTLHNHADRIFSRVPKANGPAEETVTTDHRELVIALVRSMPLTSIGLYRADLASEQIKWLYNHLHSTCPECNPHFPVNRKSYSVCVGDYSFCLKFNSED